MSNLYDDYNEMRRNQSESGGWSENGTYGNSRTEAAQQDAREETSYGAARQDTREEDPYDAAQREDTSYGSSSLGGSSLGDSAWVGTRRPDQSYIPEEPKRSRGRKSSTARRAAGLVAAGVLFGCVAGGTMAGVNAAVSRLIPVQVQADQVTQAEQTEAAVQAAQTQAETSAAIPVSTGNDVSAIVDKAMPSVVAINNKVIMTQNDWFFGKQQYEVPSSGSGIIVGQNDEELLIMTNSHVVEDAEDITVTFVDDQSVAAAVKGTDSESDLAVIAVKLSDIPEETKAQITPIEMGDSDSLKLGQGVVAIGNALGQGQSVTVGYVSALNKEITIDGVTRTLLQVDAAINPGNSGGALLDMQGKLIGINSAKTASTEVEGVGYAIPISYAKDIVDDLMTKTTKVEVAEEEQGYLGIQPQNIDSQMAKAYGMPQGIYVYKIIEGSAAAQSGLMERDIITKFDGETVRSGSDLVKMLTYYKGGTTVTLTVQRLEDGAYVERQVEVTLGFKDQTANQ